MKHAVRTLFLNHFFRALSVLLIFAFVSSASASNVCQKIFERPPAKAKVRTYEASENTSQYVRDNAPDYWRWAKTNASKFLGKIVNHEGLVIGDAHPGNFIYSPLNGKMKLFIMDIKDAGHGSFMVDLAHQIMATNIVFKEGKEDLYRSTERQLEAYVAGLKGKKYEPHERIEWIFDTTKKDYNEELAEYVEDKTDGDRFEYKEDMIEPLEDHLNKKTQKAIEQTIEAAVKKQIKGAKVLDFAFRPRERGGSKNLKRYWALVESRGKRMILEFKEIEAPAAAQYTKQLKAHERFNLVMKTFWGSLDPLYAVADIQGKPYWMRPKKVDVFAVPYKQESKEDRKFLRHLAAYEAYLMGQYHGKQTKNKKFVTELEKQFDDLVESINEMSDTYIDRLEEKVEKLQDNEDYD